MRAMMAMRAMRIRLSLSMLSNALIELSDIFISLSNTETQAAGLSLRIPLEMRYVFLLKY
jgi:hypothetical protein